MGDFLQVATVTEAAMETKVFRWFLSFLFLKSICVVGTKGIICVERRLN